MAGEKNDFSKGSIVGNIVNLAIPMTLAQLINVLYNIVDRIYIGRIPDHATLSLTGLGLCLPVISMVIAFANLFGMGGSPLCSIERGRGNEEEAERIMGNSFCMMVGCGVVLTILGLLLKRPMLYLFGASDQTFPYADSYLSIYLLGSVFVMVGLGMNSFINSQGFGKIGMMTVLLGAVANIILDPIFIFALHMGVRGAALATILSQACSCIWCIYFLLGKKTLLRIRKANLRSGLSLMPACVALGLSAFIMQSTESIISMCFNSSLLKYGGDVAVGAMTILTSVMQFAMLPLQGVAQGAQPITSYNFGAKNSARVKKSFQLLLITSLTYSVILWICVQAFPQIFAGMFTNDASLLAFSAKALRIYCGALFMMGIQIACQMTFVSTGNAVCSIIVAIMRKFVLLIPLIYILPHFLADKTRAVYTAEPIADILAVTFTIILFTVQFKKALKNLGQA